MIRQSRTNPSDLHNVELKHYHTGIECCVASTPLSFQRGVSSDLRLGSLGPSTVTFIALLYVAICGGSVATVTISVNIFPAHMKKSSDTDFTQTTQHNTTPAAAPVGASMSVQPQNKHCVEWTPGSLVLRHRRTHKRTQRTQAPTTHTKLQQHAVGGIDRRMRNARQHNTTNTTQWLRHLTPVGHTASSKASGS